jgi:Bacterial capsule synthesis protein PGA_cap
VKRLAAVLAISLVGVTACGGAKHVSHAATTTSVGSSAAPGSTVAPSPSPSDTPSPTDTRPPHEFTFAFAGDVNFADRTATRLAADPSTVFGEAQPVVSAADLTMVNLETAVTTGGVQQNKEFTFKAPPVAFTALRDAGIDIATMANNHGADFGASGLRDTLAAITASGFPVVGIGTDSAQAYAPYVTTVRGTKIAVIAASQVQDETLANFSAGANSPGIANAFSPLLINAVKAAKADGDVVITYIHWGTEYDTCPNSDQKTLAAQLAAAGATAVIGTHAHVLQGAGWRPDGVYVAYGLGNYLWWMSFGNNQDDNGVLTLTFLDDKVVSDAFSPSRLDARGVPVPATGAAAAQIDKEWATAKQCANLSPQPPG